MNRKFTQRKCSIARIAFQGLLALGALVMASAANAGPTATFLFNIPAVAHGTEETLVATLTLEEFVDAGTGKSYVQFTLDPNEDNGGFTSTDPVATTDSHIIKLDIAFLLAPTTPPIVVQSVGTGAPVVSSALVVPNPNNFDAGYNATNQFIQINFSSANDSNRFNVGEIATWTISSGAASTAGITLAQFTNTEATHNSTNFPKPIFGVLSTSPITNNSSNWVSRAYTPTVIPEPTSLALLGIGLIGFVLVRRRHASR